MLHAETTLGLVSFYLALGLLFAVAFVTVGVGRIDVGACGASVLFRLLILPGTVALWPLLAVCVPISADPWAKGRSSTAASPARGTAGSIGHRTGSRRLLSLRELPRTVSASTNGAFF